MEFGSGLDKVLKQEVTVIYGNKVRELHARNQLYFIAYTIILLNFSRNVTEADSLKSLASLLDLLGERSAKVNTFLTHFERPKLRKIYHQFSFRILGFLKTGRKRLFVHDRRGVCVECVPLCVLDFYVYEAHQRKGCGKKLFDFMLKVSVSAMSLFPCSNFAPFSVVVLRTELKVLFIKAKKWYKDLKDGLMIKK
ncbi:unnamed protein product [Schistosoma margrebowiei]|uniref:Uncharacterized protein n=1 Tax=Schistosoma margrebowiei TaxID=48269 RepID=A0A183LQP8_9TREM|nr:unnamed protein product [Schistosoma margrebowiei]